MGRGLIYLGLAIAALGVLVVIGERLPIRLGRLPGDIVYKGRHTTFYFPLMTCILLSAALSFVLWLINRFR